MTTRFGSFRGRLVLTGYLFAVMIVYALSVTMIGPLMGALIAEYALSLSGGGLLLTFQSAGGIAAIVIGGAVADRMRKGTLVWICMFVYSVALTVVGTGPSYPVLLAAFAFIGASTRLLDAVANAFIADLHPDERGKYLNLLHIFFGVGAFLGPLYVRSVLAGGGAWNGTFFLLGIACAVITALYLPVAGLAGRFSREAADAPIPAERDEAPADPALRGEHGGDPRTGNRDGRRNSPRHPVLSGRMWLLAAVMLMYVGHQVGITTWLPLYLERELGAGAFLGSLALSLFWIGIILGRAAVLPMIGRYRPLELVAGGGLTAAAVLTAAIFLKQPVLLAAACGVAGFLTGIVIPLLIETGTGWFPSFTGAAASIIFLSGTVSRMTFPVLIGAVAERSGFTAGISITAFTLFAVAAFAFPLARRRK